MSPQEQATIQDFEFFVDVMMDQVNEAEDIQREMGVGRYERY